MTDGARGWHWKLRRPCIGRAAAAGLLLASLHLAGGPALAQTLAPATPRQPPPAPEQVYPDAIDRPLQPPDVLRDDHLDADSGVQIRLGPHIVALDYPKLKVSDPGTLNLAEGVAISVDVLLGDLRLGYTREFYRRRLPAGTSYKGQTANFLAVDADQLWATLGWRPWYKLYLGAGLGGEYRLIVLGEDTTNRFTHTDSVAIASVVAEFLVASPYSIQMRIVRELARRELRLDSTTIQLAYLISF